MTDPKRKPLVWAAGAAAVALLGFLLFNAVSESRGEQTAGTNDWLVKLGDDRARNLALQKHLRGFDVTMWETGERFERLHEAVERGNSRMAVYQWDKIGQTINNGIERRPRWGAPAADYFFGTYTEVRTGLASGDPQRERRAFEQAKAACMACHRGSGVEYMNDQPLFEVSATSPGQGQ